jgi:hypothetical protein
LRCPKHFSGILAVAAAIACGREGPTPAPSPRLTFAVSKDSSDTRVRVTGLDAANLRALRDSAAHAGFWSSLLRVTVAGNDSVPIVGRYSASDSSIEFQPMFAFDRGRAYDARFDLSRLPHSRSDPPLRETFKLPAGGSVATTTVTRVFPSSDTLPENHLRFYIEFSAPMSRQPGIDFVHLIDDAGREVPHAFLPLDADFWNPDHTRFTVFLDPGRVKQGILPNEQLGRPLRVGRRYSLVVDSTWRDARGLPLARRFRREFRVGPSVLVPIALADWKVSPPKSGTRDPLVVSFPRPLDYALLHRAVGIEMFGRGRVEGAIGVVDDEREWRFTPSEAWRAGRYQLVVFSFLEDVAGNRVGQAFEVDMFERVDSTSASERHTISFIVR